jgi:hypothetical protein
VRLDYYVEKQATDFQNDASGRWPLAVGEVRFTGVSEF